LDARVQTRESSPGARGLTVPTFLGRAGVITLLGGSLGLSLGVGVRARRRRVGLVEPVTLLEETGVKVKAEELTGVYKNMRLGVVTLAFRCSVIGGQFPTPRT
jgi:hypothetical protein